MKLVSQTKFSLFYSDGKRLTYGNCLIACIASILEQPIDEVPNVYTFYGLDEPNTNIDNHLWFNVMNSWMTKKFNKKITVHTLNESPTEDFVIVRGSLLLYHKNYLNLDNMIFKLNVFLLYLVYGKT